MMRSMFSGVSGLKVHQTRMDVIGNNIANVNTMGYKSQRVTFSDVFSQTISGATAANDDTGRGGMNAMQVGLGVSVSSIDMLMTQGAAQRTDNPFDLMIDGDGFMVVGDATGRYYTRAGALRLDDVGNLVIPNGMKVQGWLAGEDGKINAQEVQDINLFDPKYQTTTPAATKEAQIAGNLQSTSKSEEVSISFYDSQGNYYTMPMIFTKGTTTTDGTEWTIKPAKMSEDKTKVIVTDVSGNQVGLDAAKLKIGEVAADAEVPFKVTFNSNGKLSKIGNTAINQDTADKDKAIKISFIDTKPTTIPTDGSTGTILGAEFNDTITVNIAELTQYATKSTATGKSTDGTAAGTLSGYSVGNDGIITATYTNGDIRNIAQVVLANFDNPAGLEKVGDNLYAATSNSGEFDGIGDAGTFSTGVLEMSNVDLSAEFTDMIVTQRGFQANSRIITVSDEMLQELTNLKR
ncbi:MAG: flagellar hook protein FlgE [Cellulosilyticum sp.]|nr:flagellar hook protein FlgE [Cellulosilyticum sp.]